MLAKSKSKDTRYVSSVMYAYFKNLEMKDYYEYVLDRLYQRLDCVSAIEGVKYDYRVPNSSHSITSRETELVMDITTIESKLEHIKKRIKFYEVDEQILERLKCLSSLELDIINDYYRLDKPLKDIANDRMIGYKRLQRMIIRISAKIGDEYYEEV